MDAVERSGGGIGFEQRYISAVFDENTLGFWLDIFTVLETILKTVEGLSADLYGYLCVLGRDIPEDYVSLLPRMLPGGGIWCAPSIREALVPYVLFDDAAGFIRAGENPAEDSPFTGYVLLKDVKSFSGADPARLYPCREKIQHSLKQGSQGNAVLLGPPFSGKRDGLSRYCSGHLKDFPSLIIRFGSGGGGISCLADAYYGEIRSLLSGYAEQAVLEELDFLASHIFRERLRDEMSDYLFRRGRRFFYLVLKTYAAAAERRKVIPVIIVENIQEADENARRVFLDIYHEFTDKRIWVYGTCADEKALPLWEGLFSRVLQLSPERIPELQVRDVPEDLLELAYACELLRRFFPGFLIPRLIEEAGKNPVMIRRALGMLSALGIIDSEADPRPRIRDFAEKAERALGERKALIYSMVRSRLLDWVRLGKLRPCFELFRILSDLGEEGSDELVLDTLYGDLSNNTYGEIERALANRRFGAIVGPNRAPALIYIFKTLKALMHGNEAEIREAFQVSVPDETGCPYYKARMLTNLAAYSLGKNDVSAAYDAIKESMLINQNQRGRGLAHTYRLFSLVNLARQRLGDALEYLAFASESAERSGDADELAVISYYAAGTYFLFGNLSKADQFARKAEQTAASAGRPEWADRSRFMQGRLCFESGRYRQALEFFEQLRNNPYGSVSAVFEAVLSAWIYRSRIFLENGSGRSPGNSPEQPLNGDALLFEIEAAYLTGDYQRAAELADRPADLFPGQGFLFIEQPDWRSGFAQCELVLFPQRTFWERMISTYRALALSRLSHPHSSDREQALRLMERIMLDERLPNTDPNDAFYCYAYYRILQENGAPEVDMNTAISMAFKRLQRRASQIEDMETKRSFLYLHYWNAALSHAAKEHKLI